MVEPVPEDAAPSPEECRTVYEKGYRIWKSLYMHCTQQSGLPQACFQFQSALLHQPYFPDTLDLQLTYKCLSVSGMSIWNRSQENCDIPPLKQYFQIPVSIDFPTPISISADSERNYQKCYIFSARWAELMPDAVLECTGSKVYNSGKLQDSAVVDVGVVDDDAARWWAAILAQGEGWKAFIKNDEFRSPWSISLQGNPKFSLSCHNNHTLLSDTAVSVTTAFGFLSDYSLSAVLFLPLLHGNRKGVVPQGQIWVASRCSRCAKKGYQGAEYVPCCQVFFYQPDVACNLVSPWLQSIFAVINPIAVEDDTILAYLLMSRVPHLAFLWLGGIIMNIHKEVLRGSQFGLIPTEPHAAAWSGTMQSFMQEPIHPVTNEFILRADECRLLYLIQEECHTRWPMCQWTPFGSTAVKDTEIEVRLHGKRTGHGHGIQYSGWKWTCQNGQVVYHMSEPAPVPTPPAAPPTVMVDTIISYASLDDEEQCASENATRSIFGWLRVEGHPPNEKKLHEWIKIDDPDEDPENEPLPDKDSGKSHEAAALRTNVEDWIDRSVCIVDDSSD
ncbi:hypothetical protein BDW62DRAFT_219460 [Aspergillus aurantiobrunneus]